MTKSGFDIDELERLLAAATDGPWRQPWGMDDPTIYAADDHSLIYDEGGHTGANAALIVAARNSLPAILTEIRELRTENARLREALGGMLEYATFSERWQDNHPEYLANARAALGEP